MGQNTTPKTNHKLKDIMKPRLVCSNTQQGLNCKFSSCLKYNFNQPWVTSFYKTCVCKIHTSVVSDECSLGAESK